MSGTIPSGDWEMNKVREGLGKRCLFWFTECRHIDSGTGSAVVLHRVTSPLCECNKWRGGQIHFDGHCAKQVCFCTPPPSKPSDQCFIVGFLLLVSPAIFEFFDRPRKIIILGVPKMMMNFGEIFFGAAPVFHFKYFERFQISNAHFR